jgi:heme/copper-type cytochrome/quinol oxidase subunit 2
MYGINISRWLLGGLVAGVIMWLAEGAASMLYMADMEAAMAAHGLSMVAGTATFLISLAVSLVAGLVLVFLYAAARSRFGPGPKTAAKMAAVMWLGGYLLSILGYKMMGLFPDRMLMLWAGVGLVEMVVASIAGAWVYHEK